VSKRLSLLAALLLLSCGCGALWLSSPYDPAYDAALEDFRKGTDAFFEDLGHTAGTPDGGWERYEPAYRALEAKLSRLTQQAILRRGNASLLQSLDLVRQNLQACEGLHRDGITPAEVGVVRQLVSTQVRLLVEVERARRREGV
jgi:hypothetical protein